MLENLINRLEHCMTRKDLNQSFDHISISIRLLLKCESISTKKRKAWKLIDMKIIKDMLSNWNIEITQSNSIDEINDWVTKIQNLLSKIIDVAVFWAKTSLHVKSYWSQKCSNAISEIKRLCRMWSHNRDIENWQNYTKSCDRKKKIIHKVKRMKFRKKIATVTQNSMNI